MFSYTPNQIEEIKKCKNDFTYFAEKYVKITHPVQGLVNFKLYGYQRRVIKEFDSHKYNIVSKFRQAGLTTLAVLWSFWRCLFKMNQRIMVLSKSDREAIGVGDIVETAIDNLPDWLKPVMKTDSAHEKEFAETNGCMWFHTPNAARSKSLTYLIIDEAAFITNMEEHWKAMYPTLSTGGNCIVISTVNGLGNWYEEIYTKASEKKNQFNVIDLDYKEHPEYSDPAWQRKTKANIGEKGWLQEYERQFLGSGETFINMNVIKDHEKHCLPPYTKMFPEWDTTNPEEMEESELANLEYEKGAMWVWKDPQPGREYIISSDVSDGVGGDFSAFSVFDIYNFEQVAEFYSCIVPPHKFAQVIARAGGLYNEALIIMENAGPGATVLNRLEHTISYPNLFYENGKGGREKPGLSMNMRIRPIIMETLQTCLMNKLLKVRSSRFIKELKTFVYNKNKQRPEALRGKHDDLVMTIGIALYVADIKEREVPPSATDAPKNRIAQSLTGKSFDDIKQIMEKGMMLEDVEDDDEDYGDVLIPIISGVKNTFYKDFGI